MKNKKNKIVKLEDLELEVLLNHKRLEVKEVKPKINTLDDYFNVTINKKE